MPVTLQRLFHGGQIPPQLDSLDSSALNVLPNLYILATKHPLPLFIYAYRNGGLVHSGSRDFQSHLHTPSRSTRLGGSVRLYVHINSRFSAPFLSFLHTYVLVHILDLFCSNTRLTHGLSPRDQVRYATVTLRWNATPWLYDVAHASYACHQQVSGRPKPLKHRSLPDLARSVYK